MPGAYQRLFRTLLPQLRLADLWQPDGEARLLLLEDLVREEVLVVEDLGGGLGAQQPKRPTMAAQARQGRPRRQGRPPRLRSESSQAHVRAATEAEARPLGVIIITPQR